MAEPLKSKRPGPLPMQRAIRAARISRRFDQVQEQVCRALEALKPLPGARATASADASRCPGCVEVKFIESDQPIRVCSRGACCTSLQSDRVPSPALVAPAKSSSLLPSSEQLAALTVAAPFLHSAGRARFPAKEAPGSFPPEHGPDSSR